MAKDKGRDVGVEKTCFQRDSRGPQICFANGGKTVKVHKNKEYGSMVAPKPPLLSLLVSFSVCTSTTCKYNSLTVNLPALWPQRQKSTCVPHCPVQQ